MDSRENVEWESQFVWMVNSSQIVASSATKFDLTVDLSSILAAMVPTALKV